MWRLVWRLGGKDKITQGNRVDACQMDVTSVDIKGGSIDVWVGNEHEYAPSPTYLGAEHPPLPILALVQPRFTFRSAQALNP